MSVKNVWVFSEKKDNLLELCAGGKELGEKVTALMIGSENDAGELIAAGADHVYCFNNLDNSEIIEAYTPRIIQLISDEKPELLLISPTVRGKVIAGRVAAVLKSSVSTDVISIVAEESKLCNERMVYGGAAIRKEASLADTTIATVGSKVLKTMEPDANRQGTVQVVEAPAVNTGIKCIERRPKVGVAVNLSAAKKIIAVGRGIAQEADLEMINKLAEIMEAEIGCTRPISEGENWLPRERYIGVSGVMQLKPEVYLAIGISGQVQHMVGCNQSRTVFAINNDKNASIFKQCDYGIIGDLYKIIPELIEKIQASK